MIIAQLFHNQERRYASSSQTYFFISLLSFTLFLLNANMLFGIVTDIKIVLLTMSILWLIPGYYIRNAVILLFGWGFFTYWWTVSGYRSDNLFFILTLVSVANAYYYKNILLVIAGVILSLIWWGTHLNYLMDNISYADRIKNISYGVGFFLMILIYFVIGQIHITSQKYIKFGSLLKTLAFIVVSFLILHISTNSGIIAIDEMLKGAEIYNFRQITFLIIMMLLTLVGLVVYQTQKDKRFIYEGVAILSLAGIALTIAFLPNLSLYDPSSYTRFSYFEQTSYVFTLKGLIIAVIFNFVTFLYLLGVIFSGLHQKLAWKINFGAVLMFIFIAIKYFDWFFESLDKSLFFISAGLLLIFLGYGMEKSRRYMLHQIESS